MQWGRNEGRREGGKEGRAGAPAEAQAAGAWGAGHVRTTEKQTAVHRNKAKLGDEQERAPESSVALSCNGKKKKARAS